MEVTSTVKVTARCARCKQTARVTIHDSLDHNDAEDRATGVLQNDGDWGRIIFDAVDLPRQHGMLCTVCCASFDHWIRGGLSYDDLADRSTAPAEEYE